jgi:cytochrome c oxidase assembly factor CtaG
MPSPRPWLAVLGMACALVVLVPPVATLARRYEVLDATQFAVLALAVPALVALGAPWSRLGALGTLAARRAARRRDRGTRLVVTPLVVEVALVVAWRTTAGVGRLERHPVLVLLEAATLVAAGLWLWLDLVDSPPLAPRTAPLWRLVLATVAMWSLWIVAYVAGMAHAGYPGFHHAAGAGLSADADRQTATAVLFVAGAIAYLPVVFASLFSWLRAEERRGDEDTRRRRAAGALGSSVLGAPGARPPG